MICLNWIIFLVYHTLLESKLWQNTCFLGFNLVSSPVPASCFFTVARYEDIYFFRKWENKKGIDKARVRHVVVGMTRLSNCIEQIWLSLTVF